MAVTLQGIFRDHFDAFARQRKLPWRVLKAASAILRCRTPALGGQVQHCPHGHVAHIQYHSCRHRSCAQCSRLARAQWAERQAARLLACDHYHVVFTLPHELLALWAFNRAPMASLLFQAARETLLTLLADARFLGATPGILMALHTWGRTLNHHPHVHCLVSGGGLTPGGDWKAVHNGYLLPVRVVKALFRGKLLAHLQTGLRDRTLRLPPTMAPTDWARLLKRLYKENWNVCLTQRYPHGQGVVKYLARYVKGGPLGDSRLRAADAQRITFAYHDHRDGQPKCLTLTPPAFLARILWHVPEARQHTIRHAGLYATQRAALYARARAALRQAAPPDLDTSWQAALTRQGLGDKTRCPRCGDRLVRGATLARTRTWDENSLVRDMPTGIAQPGVQADTPNVLSLSETGPPHTSDIFLRGGVRLN